MTKKIKTSLFLFAFISCVWMMNSCQKEKQAEGTDRELYEMAIVSTGFTWFNNSDVLLAMSSGSGHSQDFLRTRYNAVAATQLDANGRIIPGATFPEESLIVKELWEDANTLDQYAILYKNSSSPDADANGWVWGYLNENGTVRTAASSKGSSCSGCHLQADNIDYMLMNKYFP